MAQSKRKIPQHNEFNFSLPDHSMVKFSSQFDSGNCGSVRMINSGKEFIIEPYPDIDIIKQTQGWSKSWFHFSVQGLKNNTTFHILRLKMLYNLWSSGSAASYRPVFRIEEDGKPQRLQTPVKLDYDDRENTLKLSFSFDFSTQEESSQTIEDPELSQDIEILSCEDFDSEKEILDSYEMSEKNLSKQDHFRLSECNKTYNQFNSTTMNDTSKIEQRMYRSYSFQSALGDCREPMDTNDRNYYEFGGKTQKIRKLSNTLKQMQPKEKKVFFSFSYPYSYHQSQKLTQELSEMYSNDSDIYFNKETLCYSPQMRIIELITISSQDSYSGERESFLNDALFPERYKESRALKFKSSKPVILISSRVHPGETPASFAMEGLLRFLLDKQDLRSYLLRKYFTFWIVPMLNPDGVYNGHYRMDVYNQNLNRYYQIANSIKQPSIYAMKKIISLLSLENRLFFYIDFHAHAGKKGSFLYGNAIDEFSLQVENQVFSKLMAANDPTFEPNFCNFSRAQMKAKDKQEELTKEGCGRVFAYQQSKIIHSYTLECGFHHACNINQLQSCQNSNFEALISDNIYSLQETQNYIPNTYASQPFEFLTPEHFAVTGKSVLLSILDTYEKNPYSRIAAGGMDIIRKETAIELARSERIRMEDAQSYSKAKNITQLLNESFFSKINQMRLFSLSEQIQWPQSIQMQMTKKHTGLPSFISPTKQKKRFPKRQIMIQQSDLKSMDFLNFTTNEVLKRGGGSREIEDDSISIENKVKNLPKQLSGRSSKENEGVINEDEQTCNENGGQQQETSKKSPKSVVVIFGQLNNTQNVNAGQKNYEKRNSNELDEQPKSSIKPLSLQIQLRTIGRQQQLYTSQYSKHISNSISTHSNSNNNNTPNTNNTNNNNKSCSADNSRNKLIQKLQQKANKVTPKGQLKTLSEEYAKILSQNSKIGNFQSIAIRSPSPKVTNYTNFNQFEELNIGNKKAENIEIPEFDIAYNSPKENLSDFQKLQSGVNNKYSQFQRTFNKKGYSALKELVAKAKKQSLINKQLYYHSFNDKSLPKTTQGTSQNQTLNCTSIFGDHINPTEISLAAAIATSSTLKKSKKNDSRYSKRQGNTRFLVPIDRMGLKNETSSCLDKKFTPSEEQTPKLIIETEYFQFSDTNIDKNTSIKAITPKILDGNQTPSYIKPPLETQQNTVEAYIGGESIPYSESKANGGKEKKIIFSQQIQEQSRNSHPVESKGSQSSKQQNSRNKKQALSVENNNTAINRSNMMQLGNKMGEYFKYIESYQNSWGVATEPCFEQKLECQSSSNKNYNKTNNNPSSNQTGRINQLHCRMNEQLKLQYSSQLNDTNSKQEFNDNKIQYSQTIPDFTASAIENINHHQQKNQEQLLQNNSFSHQTKYRQISTFINGKKANSKDNQGTSSQKKNSSSKQAEYSTTPQNQGRNTQDKSSFSFDANDNSSDMPSNIFRSRTKSPQLPFSTSKQDDILKAPVRSERHSKYLSPIDIDVLKHKSKLTSSHISPCSEPCLEQFSFEKKRKLLQNHSQLKHPCLLIL